MKSSPQPASTYSPLREAKQVSVKHAGTPSKLPPQPARPRIEFSPPTNRRDVEESRPAAQPKTTIMMRLRAMLGGNRPPSPARTRKPLSSDWWGGKRTDAVQTILRDFEELDQDQKDKVAKNLVLLWDNFQDVFGGMSGFLEAEQAKRDAFLERLKAASGRMAPARGTAAAFHYVTVELMRQYISFFQTGRSDQKAVALATCVAALIDRGRTLAPEPVLYPVRS